jgi:hypothetical protein
MGMVSTLLVLILMLARDWSGVGSCSSERERGNTFPKTRRIYEREISSSINSYEVDVIYCCVHRGRIY